VINSGGQMAAELSHNSPGEKKGRVTAGLGEYFEFTSLAAD